MPLYQIHRTYLMRKKVVRSLAQVDFVKFDNESIFRIDPYFFQILVFLLWFKRWWGFLGANLRCLSGMLYLEKYISIRLYFFTSADLQIYKSFFLHWQLCQGILLLNYHIHLLIKLNTNKWYYLLISQHESN